MNLLRLEDVVPTLAATNPGTSAIPSSTNHTSSPSSTRDAPCSTTSTPNARGSPTLSCRRVARSTSVGSRRCRRPIDNWRALGVHRGPRKRRLTGIRRRPLYPVVWRPSRSRPRVHATRWVPASFCALSAGPEPSIDRPGRTRKIAAPQCTRRRA